MPFTPSPKWVFVVAIDDATSKHGNIVILEKNPCGFAKVVAHSSTIPGLQVGSIVFFHHQSIHQVRLTHAELNGLIHEDNVMGHIPPGEYESTEKDASKIPVKKHPAALTN